MMVSRSSAWTRRTVGARPSSRASLRSFAAANARCRRRRARSAVALAPSRRRSASTARSKLALAASSFPSRSSSRRPVGMGVAWAVQPRARSQSSDSAARANCMTERQASLAKQGEVESGTIRELYGLSESFYLSFFVYPKTHTFPSSARAHPRFSSKLPARCRRLRLPLRKEEALSTLVRLRNLTSLRRWKPFIRLR